MNKLNKSLDLSELSMGMSSDFLKAAKILQHMLELDLVFLARDLKKF